MSLEKFFFFSRAGGFGERLRVLIFHIIFVFVMTPGCLDVFYWLSDVDTADWARKQDVHSDPSMEVANSVGGALQTGLG